MGRASILCKSCRSASWLLVSMSALRIIFLTAAIPPPFLRFPQETQIRITWALQQLMSSNLFLPNVFLQPKKLKQTSPLLAPRLGIGRINSRNSSQVLVWRTSPKRAFSTAKKEPQSMSYSLRMQRRNTAVSFASITRNVPSLIGLANLSISAGGTGFRLRIRWRFLGTVIPAKERKCGLMKISLQSTTSPFPRSSPISLEMRVVLTVRRGFACQWRTCWHFPQAFHLAFTFNSYTHASTFHMTYQVVLFISHMPYIRPTLQLWPLGLPVS